MYVPEDAKIQLDLLIFAHAYKYMYVYKFVSIFANTHSHARVTKLVRTKTMRVYVRTYILACSLVRELAKTIHMHTYAQKHTYVTAIRSYIVTYRCMYVYRYAVCTYMYTHMVAYTQAHTHSRTHTHAHTHAYTHSYNTLIQSINIIAKEKSQ